MLFLWYLLSALLFAFGLPTTPGSVPAAAMPAPAAQLAKGDALPEVLVQVPPVYPQELRRKGLAGFAQVEFIVDRDGDVRDARVIRTNAPAFGDAALASVTQWKFKPGRKQGRPVNVRMTVPIIFNFNDDSPPLAPPVAPADRDFREP